MKNTFEFLVENARTVRDSAARANEAALGLVRDCQDTLNQLAQYRTDYLANAPTSRTQPVSPDLLAQYHGFVARLDAAIQVQQAELERRKLLATTATQRLMAQQKRLRSIEALIARQNAAQQARAAQQEQRASDEFAARCGFRMTAGGAA